MPGSEVGNQVDLLGQTTSAPARKRKPRTPPAQWALTAFGASWCAPWPLLREQLQVLTGEGVKVTFVDVDADPGAAERHRIITLPTILVLRDGAEKRRVTGAASVQDLREMMSRR